MARSAVRRATAALVIPRHPSRRLRWLAGLLGPVLALTAALAATVSLAAEGRCGRGGEMAGPCAWLALLVDSWLPLGIAGLALGVGCGVLQARGGRGGGLARWVTLGLAALLPLLPAALSPADGPRLAALGSAGSAVALALGILPARLADGLTNLLGGERRQWWQASLRAARLTRRTIGLGAYRQLCRTGFVRILSPLHPGRTYLVPRRTSPAGARVLVEEHGHIIGGLCLRPRQPLPDPEEVVAHVLLLRGDERAYLAAANFFPYDTILTPHAIARRL